MAERRIMKNNTDYTDERFKVGEHNYHLFDSNVDCTEFSLSKNGQVLVIIDKMTSTLSGKEQAVFESSEPLSRFKEPADRKAIQLAIDFLEKKYQ